MNEYYSVLYAEDDLNVRKNYVLYLENHFEKVYEASDGKEALSIYRDRKPDVLLLDITMTELNGLDLIKIIREDDKDTPIIILSAHSQKEFLLEAIKLNLVDYLVKPVSRNELKEVIENTIKKLSLEKINSQDDKVEITKYCYGDRRTRMFFNKNKIVDLTKNERILFELLLNKKNEVVKPSDILSYVWDDIKSDNNKDASIRNLVKRLRKKLPVDIIQSIYGSGYILNF
jgi:DNA-binding response OmpR family regulator